MAANMIIDEICRDVNDGAYHCPECDVPFTRRSNLRRHYKMHTRNLDQKRCLLCRKLFNNSEALAQHVLRCSEEHLFKQRSSQTEDADHSLSTPAHWGTAVVAGATGASNSSTSPMSPFDPGLTFGENRPGAGGFAHPGRGETERLQDEFVRLLSSLMSDTDTPSPTSPTIDLHMSRSSFGVASMVPPYHVGETVNPSSVSLDQLGTRPRSGSRSGKTYRSASPMQRRRSKEKPVYTRRQVEDMLHVVSHSLMRALDTVIERDSARH